MCANESKSIWTTALGSLIANILHNLGEGAGFRLWFPEFCSLGSVYVLPSYYRCGVCGRSHLTFFSASCRSLSLSGEGIYLYTDAILQLL